MSDLYRKIKRKSAIAWSPLSRSPLTMAFLQKHDPLVNSELIFDITAFGGVGQTALKIMEQPAVFDPKYNGTYDTVGNLIPGSGLVRYPSQSLQNAPMKLEIKAPLQRMKSAHYGGILFGTHYGHFLTESMARLWPIMQNGFREQWGNLPIVFRLSGKKPYPLDGVVSFVKKICDALGIWNRIIIPDEPVMIDRLLLREASIVNNC